MNRRTVLLAIAIVFAALILHRSTALSAISNDRNMRIALVYTGAGDPRNGELRDAFAETLHEHGIPFDWIVATDISLFGAQQLRRGYSAIVFPDSLNAQLPEEAAGELGRYAALGGAVAVIGDAGTKADNGTYRPASLFSTISGIDSVLYRTLKSKAFVEGPLHFTTPAVGARWDVPSGKLINAKLSGYGYGALTYPVPRTVVDMPDVTVVARYGATPLLAERKIGPGRVAYLALPLGYLRSHSDAFPMQLLLRFLNEGENMPHLVATPDGIGELIVDMHIDSGIEFLGIPNMINAHLLRHDVPMEFDVTAGPDLNKTGDGLGLDACGRGRALVATLATYGRIGSHGGWAHNKFSSDVENGRLSFDQIKALIDRNNRCLESVTHIPVRSFAAPSGAHPQPEMTHALDELGVEGYYYTGDTGGAAERPFFDGKLVSASSWAFPVMPFGRIASVGEMHRDHVAPAAVRDWIDQTADYASDRHGIYLVYSHSYDFLDKRYAKSFGGALDYLAAMQRAKKLRLTNMPEAAEFMTRFMQTSSTFSRTGNGLDVSLHNQGGLRNMAFAIPLTWVAKTSALPAGIHRTSTEDSFAVFAVDGDATDLHITFAGAFS